MHVEKTITWDGTTFHVCGQRAKETFRCDGCDAQQHQGTLFVLREQAQDALTFWCADCMDTVNHEPK